MSDKADKIAEIKARMAKWKAGGGAEGGAAPAEGEAEPSARPADDEPAAEAPAEDVASRVAALKAKMEAGKGKAGGQQAPAAPAAGPAKPEKKAPVKPKKKAAATQVWPVRPVDRTTFGDDRLYGPFTLDRWFVIGGVLLTIGSVLMIWRDHHRDWKQIQREARQEDIAMRAAAVEEAEQAIDVEQREQLEQQIEQAHAELAAQTDAIAELESEIANLEGEHYGKNQRFQIAKSTLDAKRYEFEELRVEHGDDPELLAESREELDALIEEVDEKKRVADAALDALKAKRAELAAMRSEETELTRALDDLESELDAARRQLRSVKHEYAWFDAIRDAPIVDMLAPTMKIDQQVLTNLKDNYNFMYVERIDRCTTCHVRIADEAFSDHEDPVFQAHPRLDLFVSDSSPHPVAEFGCTICHWGRGQAVEFPRTFHTPAPEYDEAGVVVETVAEKTERWIEEYDYDPERHYWDWPMIPKDMSYSACFQCHESQHRIEGAPVYNEARDLLETKGCYGCHEIDGLEYLSELGHGGLPHKPGPDLRHVAAKLSPDWATKWVLDPRGFRPTTHMPHFFHQSNTGGRPSLGELTVDADLGDDKWHNQSDIYVDDWRHRNEVEARAIVSYVFDRSRGQLASDEAYEALPAPGRAGDPEAGRELFRQRGCLGCHSMRSEGWTEEDHGPDLSAVGLKSDPRWLHDWLLDPRKYSPTTEMPDLRLSSEEAWDITAYLMTRRDPGEASWVDEPAPGPDPDLLEGIAMEYLASVRSEGAARRELDAMRAEGGNRAVELYVGEKLFGRYGCSGCHLVPGHEDDKGIGTELTQEALKELAKFDFAHEYDRDFPRRIEHTRREWFEHKLRDPRVFDRLPVIDEDEEGDDAIVRIDQKVKPPGDKLKMPNYYLDDHEVHLLTMFVMGLRDDGIEPEMERTLDGEERVVEHASRVMTEYNCTGCHRIGQHAVPLVVDTDAEHVVDDGQEYGLWVRDPVSLAGEVVIREDGWLTDTIWDPGEQYEDDIFYVMETYGPLGELMVYGWDEGGMGRYIEEAALRPPVLRGEGEKVHPDWLFDFLLAPYTVRHHVNVRMPTFEFQRDEASALARWFAARDEEPWPFAPDPDPVPDPELMARGAELFETYGCYQCHPGGRVEPSNPQEDWGPNLGLAAERLKLEWIHDWLKDPQSIQPGTKMPTFFGETSDREYEVYDPNWKENIRALQHYLRHLETASGDDSLASR